MTEERDDFWGFDEPVVVPITDVFDLHTFLPKDIPSVVEEYLSEALALGFREVRIIHGKGKGVQREVVRKILAAHPLVKSFYDAPHERGGKGATIAELLIVDS